MTRRVLAFATAWLVPGFGHFLLGYYGRAAAVWLLLSCFAPVTLMRAVDAGFRSAVVVFVAWTAVWIISVVDVVRTRAAPRSPGWAVGIVTLTVMLVIGVLLSPLVPLEAFRVPSESMSPTLLTGDRFLARTGEHRPRRGDVLVFTVPERQTDHLKRVVALGGDTIVITTNGGVVVNGTVVEQRATGAECSGVRFPCQIWKESVEDRQYCVAIAETAQRYPMEFVVPHGSFFAMGDNRDNSEDSRHYGPVPISQIRGRPDFLYFSRDPETGTRSSRIGLSVQSSLCADAQTD